MIEIKQIRKKAKKKCNKYIDHVLNSPSYNNCYLEILQPPI